MEVPLEVFQWKLFTEQFLVMVARFKTNYLVLMENSMTSYVTASAGSFSKAYALSII